MTEPWNKPYRPATMLVTSVSILLGLTVLVRLLGIATSLLLLASGKINPEPEEFTPVHWMNCGVVCLALPLFIATIIVWCFWVYRANSNAHALGAAGMDYTPGWSVGWWFIPIMFWFKPYNAVKETWQASDPSDPSGSSAWKSVAAPWFMGAWWGFWVLGNILTNISMRLSLHDSASASMLTAATWIEIAADGLMIVAAALAILVVRGIHARQEAKSAEQLGAA